MKRTIPAALAIVLLPLGLALADEPKKPDIAARVKDVSPDGKTLTLTNTSKGGQVTTHSVKITGKTQIDYVGAGFFGTETDADKKIKPGWFAQIWLEKGSKDTAAALKVNLPKPDLVGIIGVVPPGGKKITVESKDKDDKVTKTEVAITDKTRIDYVGLKDAEDKKLKVDYAIAVWLEKGSKDQASYIKAGIRKKRAK